MHLGTSLGRHLSGPSILHILQKLSEKQTMFRLQMCSFFRLNYD